MHDLGAADPVADAHVRQQLRFQQEVLHRVGRRRDPVVVLQRLLRGAVSVVGGEEEHGAYVQGNCEGFAGKRR